MDKKFLTASIFLSLFVSFFLIDIPQAKALTAAEISIQISQLQAQITELQKQIDKTQLFQAAGFNIISPNGGEKWEIGSTHDITWYYATSSARIAKIKLELYRVGSLTVAQTIVFSAKNSGTYPWKIPTTLSPSVDYKIKITAISKSAVTDVSNQTFEIYFKPAAFTIVSPNGGEKLEMGLTYDITWNSTGSVPTTNVKLELYRGDNFVNLIAKSIKNKGVYSWRIPSNLIATAGYKIKITDIFRPAATDMSNNSFEISYPSISEKLKTIENQLSSLLEEIKKLPK
ncbi:MAG: GPI anchored serine-threonine rich family protein [Patescibacteria group bacterium]